MIPKGYDSVMEKMLATRRSFLSAFCAAVVAPVGFLLPKSYEPLFDTKAFITEFDKKIVDDLGGFLLPPTFDDVIITMSVLRGELKPLVISKTIDRRNLGRESFSQKISE